MTDKTYRTKSGKTLTNADIDALADEVTTTDYDTAALKARRRGRPLLGPAPAAVVPIGSVLRAVRRPRHGEDVC